MTHQGLQDCAPAKPALRAGLARAPFTLLAYNHKGTVIKSIRTLHQQRVDKEGTARPNSIATCTIIHRPPPLAARISARTAALSGLGSVGQAVMISCRSRGILLPCERRRERRLFLFNEDGGLVRGSNSPPRFALKGYARVRRSQWRSRVARPSKTSNSSGVNQNRIPISMNSVFKPKRDDNRRASALTPNTSVA